VQRPKPFIAIVKSRINHWGQGDALGLMQQLGVIFLPSPKLLPYILKGIVSKLFKKSD